MFYQIAINGKRDMALAPDPRSGFEMLLLRMLAFRPAVVIDESAGDVQLQAVGSPPGKDSAALEVGDSAKKSPEPLGEVAPPALTAAAVTSGAGSGCEPPPESEPRVESAPLLLSRLRPRQHQHQWRCQQDWTHCVRSSGRSCWRSWG